MSTNKTNKINKIKKLLIKKLNIIEEIQEKDLNEITKDPYKILTAIPQIDFKKADEIILKANLIDRNSIKRAKAGIIYSIRRLLITGNSIFAVYNVKDIFLKLLGEDFNESDFYKALEELKKENVVLEIDNEITIKEVFDIEKKIFDFIKEDSFVFETNKEKIDEFIKNYEKENSIKLDEKQKEAIISFLTSDKPLYIIAGYAGTGKTTISKAIISYLKQRNYSIIGCALAGTAANRLKSVAKIEAKTIHSLLGYYKKEKKKAKKVFYLNLIIIDEASMVGSKLLKHLFDAINTKRTKILMLGDNAQLPPVSWGEPFSDLLESNLIPKTKLTKIFRQDSDKVITYFASFIRKGEIPPDFHKKYKDFNFVSFDVNTKNLTDEEKRILRNELNLNIRNYILNKFKQYKKSIIKNLELYKQTNNKKFLKDYINRIQLLSPIKKGILGTEELNIEIKNILNPIQQNYHSFEIRNDNIKKTFSIYDKVIHLKNTNLICSKHPLSLEEVIQGYYDDDFEKIERVFNGQVGIITNILQFQEKDEDNTAIEVYYPNEEYYAYYPIEDFKNKIIDLAYSITIHKSQGQEYESVIIPITFSHFKMLNNKLLYTAVTRAKERVNIVGEKRAFSFGCRNFEEIKRNTLLKKFLNINK